VRVERVGDEVGGCALEKPTRPPSWPAPGPRSTIQSACAMTAWWCSITMTDLPESTSRVEQAEQLLDVGEVQAAGRLVEDNDLSLLGSSFA